MYHNYLIHSSVDGHLGCFHVLVLVFSCFTMSCWFLLHRSESAVHISPLFRFPSHLGHHRALIELPVLYSRFSLVICFTHNSVYTSTPVCQFIPPPFPLFGVHMFVLYICVSNFSSVFKINNQ